MSGVALELFNKNHTVVGKGMMKTTDSGVGATIDTSSTYENDLVIFKVSNVVGSTTARRRRFGCLC